MNTTTNESYSMENSTSEIIEIFYQLAFFIIGIPINITAMIKTSRHIREGGVESRLIRLSRQLLIAHVMVLSIYGAWRSYWIYTIVWIQGEIMCKIFSFLCALPFHLWSNLVAAIAIDMLCCITSPLSSYRTGSNRVSWLIALAWFIALVCCTPMIVLRGLVPIHNTTYVQCYPMTDRYSHDVLIAFNLFHVSTAFYIPLSIIIICYFLIGLSIKKQMAERRLLQDGGHFRNNSNTKVRFLRASVSIICTFFFTWLPYQVLALLRIICDSEECQNVSSKLNWVQAIIVASTSINPFLYRFGTEPKRSSYYCSSMETGSRFVRRSTTAREEEKGPNQYRGYTSQRYITVSQQSGEIAANPRSTTVRQKTTNGKELKNSKSNEI